MNDQQVKEHKAKNFWNFSSSNKGKYESPEELQEKILEYFKEGRNFRQVYDGDSQRIRQIPILTITWLVLYLGFANRKSFYDYEAKPLFSHTIKRARTFIEMEYEEMLSLGNHTAAIFALKNFGWKDIQTHEWELNDNWEKRFVIEHKRSKYENLDENWEDINEDWVDYSEPPLASENTWKVDKTYNETCSCWWHWGVHLQWCDL